MAKPIDMTPEQYRQILETAQLGTSPFPSGLTPNGQANAVDAWVNNPANRNNPFYRQTMRQAGVQLGNGNGNGGGDNFTNEQTPFSQHPGGRPFPNKEPFSGGMGRPPVNKPMFTGSTGRPPVNKPPFMGPPMQKMGMPPQMQGQVMPPQGMGPNARVPGMFGGPPMMPMRPNPYMFG